MDAVVEQTWRLSLESQALFQLQLTQLILLQMRPKITWEVLALSQG